MVRFGAVKQSTAISTSEVITNSQMWLSMVAGTTLAILLYCAGATASIVYALYNAPTFYKEGDSVSKEGISVVKKHFDAQWSSSFFLYRRTL